MRQSLQLFACRFDLFACRFDLTTNLLYPLPFSFANSGETKARHRDVPHCLQRLIQNGSRYCHFVSLDFIDDLPRHEDVVLLLLQRRKQLRRGAHAVQVEVLVCVDEEHAINLLGPSKSLSHIVHCSSRLVGKLGTYFVPRRCSFRARALDAHDVGPPTVTSPSAHAGPRYGSLDYFIRPPQQRRRDRQAEGLGGLEVDDQLELGWAFNGEVAGFGTLEDSRDVTACPVPRLVEARVVGHEPTRDDPVPRRVNSG